MHGACILCSIKSNLPQGKPDSFRLGLCSQSTDTQPPSISPHYCRLHWFQSQIPRAPKMDHSIFPSNQSQEFVALLAWLSFRSRSLMAGVVVGWGSCCPGQKSSFWNLSTHTWKGQKEGVKTEAGAGQEGGRFNPKQVWLKKRNGYLTLAKTLTLLNALLGTWTTQLCCRIVNPHPEC